MQSDFSLPSSRLSCLRRGAVTVREDAAVFQVEGPGALTCLQGLLTSDLVAAGDGSLLFGALLSPKGMIIADPWVLREGERFTLVVGSTALTSRSCVVWLDSERTQVWSPAPDGFPRRLPREPSRVCPTA